MQKVNEAISITAKRFFNQIYRFGVHAHASHSLCSAKSFQAIARVGVGKPYRRIIIAIRVQVKLAKSMCVTISSASKDIFSGLHHKWSGLTKFERFLVQFKNG